MIKYMHCKKTRVDLIDLH